MPQKTTRIAYDTFIYAEPQQTAKLSPFEKAENNLQERANHVIALFWLLSQIDLQDSERPDDEYINMTLRNAGSLGTQIAEGILGDLSIIADAMEEKEKNYEPAIS